jgi:predicted transcriptional regulator
MPWPGFGKSPLQQPETPKVKLSSDGNIKMLHMIPQGFQYMVMDSIKKQEPSCTVADVAKDLNWDENKVKSIMEQLYRDGWIERA